ncbi:MAG: hypothetical protein WD993_06735 [Thermoleophilaceae bacterium]
MAVLAPSAMANQVEVSEGHTGLHCPPVSQVGHSAAGGCADHVVTEGQVHFSIHALGMTIDAGECDHEFTLRLDEDGNGYAHDNQFSNCTRPVRPCDEADGHPEPWPVQTEETQQDEVTLTIDMCVVVVDGLIMVQCEGPTAVMMMTNTENHEARASDQRIGTGPCEMTAHWLFEEQHIQIDHL